MPSFHRTDFVRLYSVKKNRCEEGKYNLKPIIDENYNKEFRLTELGKKIGKTCMYFFTDGDYSVIDYELMLDLKGNIRIEFISVDGKNLRLIIPDIRGSINTKLNILTYCILVDFECKKYYWVAVGSTRIELRG